MSTSDPDRPADDTTTPATVPTSPDAPTSPRSTKKGAKEPEVVAPAAETPVETRSGTPPTVEAPVVAAPTVDAPAVVAPVAAAPADAKTEPVSLDTGRHAVVRPTPVPPADVPAEPTPVAAPTTATPTVEPSVAAVTAASVASAPQTRPAPITPEPEDDGRLFPDPNAPSSPTLGSRILGILVGLVLAPISVGVLLLGESQILESQVDGWDATTSVFGIVLVTLGLLLLGCVLLLGVWTAAVPITGGALLTAAGAVYLYAPSLAREQTLTILSSTGWRPTIVQVTVAATSGMVIAVGFLLLLAGLVIASARRRGVHLGEFRERHKV